MVELATITEADAFDVVSQQAGGLVVSSPTAWAPFATRFPHLQPTWATSLELIALEAAAERSRSGPAADAATVVGIGGGLALDAAKDLALRTGRALVLVPTALSTIAPFTNEIARRSRRQITWTGDVAATVILDFGLLGAAPPALNRAGAAEVVATISALWDWRLADTRGIGLPLSSRLVELAERCRAGLSDAAGAVAACSPEGLRALAELLGALGSGCARAGLRRPIDGSEHTFVQAYEHRLGPHATYGGMVGLGTVAMATLQQWFGLSAGGPVDPSEAIDLLTRCKVAANPDQLGLDEGTFRGVLRHTVRFAVGESLPYSVLNEADVNWSASEEMWRQCWRVPRVAGY